jgi:uncharacterized protein YdhG (YjbR/CyaY superfamily)
MAVASSVDEYIAAQPEASRSVLQRVRGAIRKALPGAEECISYVMPTYRMGGRPVIYFAGWKQHYSLYPASADLLEALRQELEPYTINGSTIRFPLSGRIPVKLIERIAKFRATECAARAKATRSG